MKIRNRIFSAAAAVCMASTVLLYPGSYLHGRYSDNVSLSANADEYNTSDLELKYVELDDGIVEITKYISSVSTDIELPSAINGKKVTSIGDSAFYNCIGLTSITIPDGITSIGDEAFEKCSSLKTVTIPDSVTNIGRFAFSTTPWLTSKQAENPIVVINGILIDGRKSFGDVIIPNGVTSIGDYAFSDCVFNTGLTSITIPGSVTSIGDYAFSGCTELTTITIPDSVTSIGYWALSNCTLLKSITIPNSITNIKMNTFYRCTRLKSIIIPDSVTSIDWWAFDDCTALKSITIKNPDCKMSLVRFPDNATIYGYKNSTAQKYAEKYGNTFVELDDEDDCSFSIADLVTLQKWLINGKGELANWKKYDLYEDNQLDAFDLVLMRQQLLKNSK